MNLGFSAALDLDGEVTWQRPGDGFGVRWVEPGMGERKLLDRLIQRLAANDS